MEAASEEPKPSDILARPKRALYASHIPQQYKYTV